MAHQAKIPLPSMELMEAMSTAVMIAEREGLHVFAAMYRRCEDCQRLELISACSEPGYEMPEKQVERVTEVLNDMKTQHVGMVITHELSSTPEGSKPT